MSLNGRKLIVTGMYQRILYMSGRIKNSLLFLVLTTSGMIAGSEELHSRPTAPPVATLSIIVPSGQDSALVPTPRASDRALGHSVGDSEQGPNSLSYTDMLAQLEQEYQTTLDHMRRRTRKDRQVFCKISCAITCLTSSCRGDHAGAGNLSYVGLGTNYQ